MSAKDHGTKSYSWPRKDRKRKGIEITLPPDKVAAYRSQAAREGITFPQWAERAMDEALARAAPKSPTG